LPEMSKHKKDVHTGMTSNQEWNSSLLKIY